MSSYEYTIQAIDSLRPAVAQEHSRATVNVTVCGFDSH